MPRPAVVDFPEGPEMVADTLDQMRQGIEATLSHLESYEAWELQQTELVKNLGDDPLQAAKDLCQQAQQDIEGIRRVASGDPGAIREEAARLDDKNRAIMQQLSWDANVAAERRLTHQAADQYSSPPVRTRANAQKIENVSGLFVQLQQLDQQLSRAASQLNDEDSRREF